MKIKEKSVTAAEKTLNSRAGLHTKASDAYHIVNAVKDINKSPNQQPQEESTPEATAINTVENIGYKSAHQIEQQGKLQAKQQTKQLIDKVKRSRASKAIHTGKRQPLKTRSNPIKTASKSLKNTGNAIKASQKYSKVIPQTAKQSIKTSKNVTAAVKHTTTTAVKMAKTLAKLAAEAIKAIIAALKSLISAIIAGGWVAVIVIIIVALIAVIISSPFGLFFSSDESTTQPMSEIVKEINAEFIADIEDIKNSNTYDELEVIGIRATWKDVLTVFAVLTTTDVINPMDVAFMNDEKKQKLQDIFYEMNKLTYSYETIEVTVYEPLLDEYGNPTFDEEGYPIEEEIIIQQIVLHIDIDGLTVYDMIDKNNMNDTQIELLNEMLLPEYNDLWMNVLYGSYSMDNQIVNVALSQVGNDGQLYWSWYGFTYEVEWCACFVSWCANECGYIDEGIIPKFAGCEWSGKPWFKSRGLWQDNSYIPSPGTIIFFDWDHDGIADHVGIVEKVEDNYVYTIEGNADSKVKQRKYPLGDSRIDGYGTPNYN